jgi:hypothetical protein
MKMYGKAEVKVYALLTLALDGGKGQLTRSVLHKVKLTLSTTQVPGQVPQLIWMRWKDKYSLFPAYNQTQVIQHIGNLHTELE